MHLHHLYTFVLGSTSGRSVSRVSIETYDLNGSRGSQGSARPRRFDTLSDERVNAALSASLTTRVWRFTRVRPMAHCYTHCLDVSSEGAYNFTALYCGYAHNTSV